MSSSLSKIILSLSNIAILIFGIYYIADATYIDRDSSLNTCLREGVSRIRWIGVTCLVVALIGISGMCTKLKAVESVYLFALLIPTIASVAFFVFVYVLMPKTSAAATFAQIADDGVWLKQYRPTLRKAVVNEKDWFHVTSCFREIDTCRIMANQTEDQKVPYIDIGCCSPPVRCGMKQSSTGRWVAPENGLSSTDDECKMWLRLGQNCFDCDSCKAGYLANFQQNVWDKNMTHYILGIIVLIITSALAYYTFINDHFLGKNKTPKHGKLVSHV